MIKEFIKEYRWFFVIALCFICYLTINGDWGLLIFTTVWYSITIPMFYLLWKFDKRGEIK